jgi:nitrogenase molybdenum-iron protein alpha/beta subunit
LEDEDEFVDELQPTSSIASASKNVIPESLFIANSESKKSVVKAWGSRNLLHDNGNTLAAKMSRNRGSCYRKRY